MQVSSDDKEFLGHRIRYYQALIDSAILKRGDNYKDLKNLYIIFICPFALFNGERQVYFFKNYCRDDKDVQLEDRVTKILISTKGKEEENLDKDLKAFMYYINGMLPENDFVKTVNSCFLLKLINIRLYFCFVQFTINSDYFFVKRNLILLNFC